jgi:hypothetical protein
VTQKPSPSGLQKNGAPVTDWPTIRNYVLNRDKHICQTCEVNTAGEVDHVWPKRLGGPDHIDNLRAICAPCNKAKGARVDLSAASGHQLRLARTALRARIEVLQAEYNDVINEDLRRDLASGQRANAEYPLRVARGELRQQTRVVEQWEKLFDLAYPPENISERVRAVELAVLRLAGSDEHAVVRECTQSDLLSILRAFGVFRELADAALPGVSPNRPTTLSNKARRVQVISWLQTREALRQRAEDSCAADRQLATDLLEYMPDEKVTVEQAIEARKKAQP